MMITTTNLEAAMDRYNASDEQVPDAGSFVEAAVTDIHVNLGRQAEEHEETTEELAWEIIDLRSRMEVVVRERDEALTKLERTVLVGGVTP